MPLTRRELLSAAAGAGQETFRSEANLVQVRFSVMRGRQFVTDLSAEDVVLTEDGKPRKLTLFEGPLAAWQERQAIDFRVLVDLSGSAQQFRPLTGELLSRTLLGAIRRHTTVSLYGFAYDCRRLAGPTRDSGELNAGIRRLGTEHVRQELPAASRIFESVVQVAQEKGSDQIQVHPVLVIFSDGKSSGSGRTLHEAVEASLRAGMTVYPVLLANPADRDGRDEQLIEEYAKIGEETGGRSFWPAAFTAEHLERILGHIANQVRAEYTVGYYRREQVKGVRIVRVKLKDRSKGRLYGGIRRVGM